MSIVVIGLALLGNVSMTSGEQWFVPLRVGCQQPSASVLSPNAAIAVARRDGYEVQVTGSGGEEPDVVMVKSEHPLFQSMGGGMLFARNLAACERLRIFGTVWDALEDTKYE